MTSGCGCHMITKDSPTYCFILEVYSHFTFGEITKINISLKSHPYFICGSHTTSLHLLQFLKVDASPQTLRKDNCTRVTNVAHIKTEMKKKTKNVS